MSDLYDTDVLEWSQRQAQLLRRRAAGDPVNEAELDWLNIAEEINSLGHSERSRLRSHIAAVIEHRSSCKPLPQPIHAMDGRGLSTAAGLGLAAT